MVWVYAKNFKNVPHSLTFWLQTLIYRAFEHGRDFLSPSRYPPFFGFFPSLWERLEMKTGGRREGQSIYPPMPQPFVHRPFEPKREEGRDIFEFSKILPTLNNMRSVGMQW